MPPSMSARPEACTQIPRRGLGGSLVAAAATVALVTVSLAVAGPGAATRHLVASLPAAAVVSPDARDAMAGEPVASAPAAPAPEPAATTLAVAAPSVAVEALAVSRPAAVPLSAAPAVQVSTPPPAPVLRNMLVSDDGSLRTGIGTYSDCSGRTPLTHAVAAVDTCVAGPTYFVGHNPGVFTPLMSMSVGAVITWYDGGGAGHRMRIVSIRDGWASAGGAPAPTQRNVVAQFQTCETYSPSGAYDRIVDLVAI